MCALHCHLLHQKGVKLGTEFTHKLAAIPSSTDRLAANMQVLKNIATDNG